MADFVHYSETPSFYYFVQPTVYNYNMMSSINQSAYSIEPVRTVR